MKSDSNDVPPSSPNIACSTKNLLFAVWLLAAGSIMLSSSTLTKLRLRLFQGYSSLSSTNAMARSENQLKEEMRLLIARSKKIIPIWMEHYLEWHAHQRRYPSNETKYLVARCLYGEKCGGISDRLKPLPFYVLLANATNRVLLLHWEKPCALEEFLVPPKGGLDWRVKGTSITIENIKQTNAFYNSICMGSPRECFDHVTTDPTWISERVVNLLPRGGLVLSRWSSLFCAWHGVFDQQEDNVLAIRRPGANVSSDHDLMQDIFRLLFEPSRAVSNIISREMTAMGIVSGRYVAAHVRAKKPQNLPKGINLANYSSREANFLVDLSGELIFEGKAKEWIVSVMTNAVNCAASLGPGLPVYVVSDTIEAVQYMLHNASTPHTIVASNRTDETHHVDWDGNAGRNASDFYPAFTDLFIMSKSKCISRGSGGYSLFSKKIGGITCDVLHRKNDEIMVCPGPDKSD